MRGKQKVAVLARPRRTQSELESKDYISHFEQKIQDGYCQVPLEPDVVAHIEKFCSAEILCLIERLKDNKNDSSPSLTIFHGPAGEGKRTIMKFIAMKLGWPYYMFHALDFSDTHIDSGAQNLNFVFSNLLEKHKEQPAICIFQDITAVSGRKKNAYPIEDSCKRAFWHWQNILRSKKNLVLFGTTFGKFRPELFLCHPGVDALKIQSIKDIFFTFPTLKFLLSKKNYRMSDEFLEAYSHEITDLNPRYLQELVSNAVLKAHAREQKYTIINEDMEEGLDRLYKNRRLIDGKANAGILYWLFKFQRSAFRNSIFRSFVRCSQQIGLKLCATLSCAKLLFAPLDTCSGDD